ncbi:MAG: hypothetical protein AAF654_12145 [Myxococcota bacterium]
MFPDPAANPLAGDVLTSKLANPTTVLTLSFTVTEDVVEPVLAIGDQPIAFTVAGRVANTWSFNLDWATVPALTEGTFDVLVSLEDPAGNRSPSITLLAVTIDSAPPVEPAVDSANRIRFVRAPWGRVGSGGAEVFSLEGQVGSVAANDWLLVYSDAAGTREIARVQSNANGAFGGPDGTSPFDLPIADTSTVYLRSADPSGNTSGTVVRVRDVTWVANGNGKVLGSTLENPHALAYTPYLAGFLNQGGVTALADAGLGTNDDTVQVAAGGAVWWTIDATGLATVPDRAWSGMAYDPISGETLLVEGQQVTFAGVANTCDSPPRTAILYERSAERGRIQTMLGEVGSADLRAGVASLVYDGTRQQMMYVANLQQAVRVNGQWQLECTLAADCGGGENRPSLNFESARRSFEMVYDPLRNRVVAMNTLFDGVRIYEWDGSAWSRRCTESPCVDGLPSGGSNAALAYDESLETIVAFGLGAEGRETWSWNGSGWQQLCTDVACSATRPEGRVYSAMVFFGGTRWEFDETTTPSTGSFYSRETNNETWSFDGSGWSRLCDSSPCSDTVPSDRAGHRMSYNGNSGEVLLFGGATRTESALGDTWIWRGDRWEELFGAAPEPRANHSLTWVPELASTILIGGTDRPATQWRSIVSGGFEVEPEEHQIPADYANVWRWDGVAWSIIPTIVPRPKDRAEVPRYQHDSAWIPARQEILVYGGYDTDTLLIYGDELNQEDKLDTARTWDPEFDGRPALLFTPDLRRVGSLFEGALVGVDVEWRGSASSDTASGTTDRAAILAWDGTGWRDLGATRCGTGCESSTARAFLSRLVRSDGARFALAPAGTNGASPNFARLATDYFEVRFAYRLPAN